jgi:hypothetical protein
MKSNFLKLFKCILTTAAIFLISSCAGRELKAIPSSPPTAKLRIYVEAISAPFPYPTGAGAWDSFHKEFAARQISGIGRFLDMTGIYEVIDDKDVKTVLGEQTPSYIEMRQNNWRLAKEIGKALFAEYIFVIERRMEKTGLGTSLDYYLTIDLININSEKVFEASTRIDAFDRSNNYTMSLLIRELYRTVFMKAKSDMLGTAIRKSEKMQLPDVPVTAPEPKIVEAAPKPEEPKIVITHPETKPQVTSKAPDKPVTAPEQKIIAAVPKPETKITPPPPEIKHQVTPITPDAPVTAPESKIIVSAPKPEPKTAPPIPEMKLTMPEPKHIPDTVYEKSQPKDSDMNRLVIYDLDAPEQYRPVALILTEVLREELFQLNRFVLVNRENILDILHEMKIQQSGLTDEKLAVKAGKGLAANQMVTGKLGILGQTYLLQAKRTDVESFATLGMASARFKKGQEEDVLSKLPALAKDLTGMH